MQNKMHNPIQSYLLNSSHIYLNMTRTFHVIIEQDEDNVYIGKVPELSGCVTQGDTLDELMKNIKEAIELCLEVREKENNLTNQEQLRFVGMQEIQV